MTTRNIIALILIIMSLVCLYPGLTEDILTLDIGAKIPLIGDFELYNETQSILKTIRTLHENDSTLVAGLILLFSVIVPVLKALALLAVLFIRNMKNSAKLYKFVGLIGKWSMADVFVIAIFLAYFALDDDRFSDATIGLGLYFFAAYCLLAQFTALYLLKDGENGKGAG